jgi:hypothetical protein
VPTPAPTPYTDIPQIDPIAGLKALIGSPNYASKAWVYEQYDTQVMADTLRTPGFGAGIVRIHGTSKAVAFTSDVTPRYVKANPVEGGKQAVAEAYRNLTAQGAKPLATTDNLNFGNPEKPEVMGQFVGAIQGIGAACAALDMPIVSGNVSLYNETDGTSILPTPTIGAIGLFTDLSQIIRGPAQDGDTLILIGTTTGHLGQSALLAEAFGHSNRRRSPRRPRHRSPARRLHPGQPQRHPGLHRPRRRRSGTRALRTGPRGQHRGQHRHPRHPDALRRGSGALPHRLRPRRGPRPAHRSADRQRPGPDHRADRRQHLPARPQHRGHCHPANALHQRLRRSRGVTGPRLLAPNTAAGGVAASTVTVKSA